MDSEEKLPVNHTIAMTPLEGSDIQYEAYVQAWNKEIPTRSVSDELESCRLDLTDSEKADLFKKSVQHVYIEPFSYCNRRCYFCPNTDGKRLLENVKLERSLISSVYSDLASIDYNHAISFHGYNEPFADEVTIELIEEASAKVPDARITLTTNGDYLDAKILERLTATNVTFIKLSLYGPNHGHFDSLAMQRYLERLSERTGCSVSQLTIDDTSVRKCLSARLDHEKIQIEIYGVDYGVAGFDRGDLVSLGREKENVERVRPCFAPLTEFHIDHLGYMKPCCNLSTDREEHAPYRLESLSEGKSVFDMFFSRAAIEFRKATMQVNPTPDVCKSCTWPWT